jgi:restriction endonuclease S subunit
MVAKAEMASKVYVPYVYYFLLAHKDDLLVPLMRGAANVSLNLDRLKKLKIPLPKNVGEQKKRVEDLENRYTRLNDARREIERISLELANCVSEFAKSF